MCIHSASQSERIELIKMALRNKVGEGGMKHYGLERKVPQLPYSIASTQAERVVQPNIDNHDEGMHL